MNISEHNHACLPYFLIFGDQVLYSLHSSSKWYKSRHLGYRGIIYLFFFYLVKKAHFTISFILGRSIDPLPTSKVRLIVCLDHVFWFNNKCKLTFKHAICDWKAQQNINRGNNNKIYQILAISLYFVSVFIRLYVVYCNMIKYVCSIYHKAYKVYKL